jgi:outer membrane protein OmpA-like peptidoglycan-associated protein
MWGIIEAFTIVKQLIKRINFFNMNKILQWLLQAVRQTAVLFLCCWTGDYARGQNLVVNGGFERLLPDAVKRGLLTPCTFAGKSVAVNNGLEAWQTFETQTPDVLEFDTAFAGCTYFPAPYRGKRMVGLILYHPFYDNMFSTDYHEFLQGQLAKPLVVGSVYRVSVWVQLNRDLARRHLSTIYGNPALIVPLSCGNLGFYFSENPINPKEDFMRTQELVPLRPQLNHPDTLDAADGTWHKLQFVFVARHPYQYFVFGNFYSDAVTDIPLSPIDREEFDQENLRSKETPGRRCKRRVAYYLVDNFAVLEVPADDPARSFYHQKNVVLEAAVLFDVNSATLKPAAADKLKPIADVLKNDPALRVEVGGHADSSGDPTVNQQLSELRAQAVWRCLVDLGVPQKQLSWKGYGFQMPIGDNNTDAGRAMNRRVEVRVVD